MKLTIANMEINRILSPLEYTDFSNDYLTENQKFDKLYQMQEKVKKEKFLMNNITRELQLIK